MRLVQSIAGRRESADAQPVTSTSSTRLLHHGQSADLEQISIVSSNATPSQVTYGTGLATANGPRIVPGKSMAQGRSYTNRPFVRVAPGPRATVKYF